MLGLVKPAAGHVYIHGQPYGRQRRKVGYVPQRSSVDWDFPTTALDVVTMGLYGKLGWFRRPGHRDRAAALGALEQVGMDAFAERQISQLSGGQQQRVFLARALVQDAEVYFMDEPMAGVDATTERAIIGLVESVAGAGKNRHRRASRLADGRGLLRLDGAPERAHFGAGAGGEVYTAEHLRRAYGEQFALLNNLRLPQAPVAGTQSEQGPSENPLEVAHD